ncbi:MAG: DUF1015 family protein, partial [Nitrospirota bacterium]
NMLDRGLTILPTHRLVKEIPDDINTKLSEYFEIEKMINNFEISDKISDGKHVFGFFKNQDKFWYLLKYESGKLSEMPGLLEIDVIILHDLLFKKILRTTDIGYEMDLKKTLDKVRSGKFGAAFFLNPTKVEDVEKAALSSVRMPPKSTYFYPKLLTGIVINSFSVFDGAD